MLVGIWVMMATTGVTGGLTAAPSQVELDYQSQAGLSVKFKGVTVVRGSFFQFYEQGWTRGYYSSNWNDQTVTRADGVVTVTFRSEDGKASGELKFVPREAGFRSEYRFKWGGDAPVWVENTLGFLWSPALAEGKLSLSDNASLRRPMSERPSRGASVEARGFGESTQWRFEAALGQMTIDARTGGPFTVFDARGYDQDWADNRDLFWAGWPGLMVPNGGEVTASADWSFSAPAAPATEKVPPATATWTKLSGAIGPFSVAAPLLPAPKSMANLGAGVGATLPSRRLLTQGDGIPARAVEELAKQLGRRFADLPTTGTPARITVHRDATLPAGGFTLRIDAGQIGLGIRDDAGARQGLQAIAQLARVDRGRVVLPRVVIRDWPSAQFRGVHLFTGPKAPEFQRLLMARLFGPLGYSHVVLQAERTDWAATPGIRTAMTMDKSALRQLVQDYRNLGIEPIPLIQSWGHMEWLFANNQNRDLVFNPKDAYAIDVRNPAARAKIEAIWSEAIDLLKPSIIHVGLDEVDMRGGPIPPKELTKMWADYLPWLGEFAAKKGVRLMLWGDKLLAPGEAPDAAHAGNKTESKARRDATPKGTMIADWHYVNNPKPEVYTSLALLKEAGFEPVASTWSRSANIVGFFRAAQSLGYGGLQTTWAGYESNLENMLRAEDQFAAYVVAGDQLWSGRHTDPNQLGYDPKVMLYRLVFAPTTPLKPVPGWTLGSAQGTPFTIGDVKFRPLPDGALFYPLDQAGAGLPERRSWSVGRPAREVIVALKTQTTADGSQEVGRVTITFGDGTVKVTSIRYGWHVRSVADPQGTLTTARDVSGRSALRIYLGAKPLGIRSISVETLVPEAGLSVEGLTLR